MTLVVVWISVAIAVFLVDILTSNFFFALFSIGAILSAVGAAFGLTFQNQVIIFAIVSIISLIVFYPILKKFYKNLNKKTPLMEENYIGRIMTAQEDILDKVQIKVGGEYWTAINEGEKILAGEKFIITGIEGIKLKIKKS